MKTAPRLLLALALCGALASASAAAGERAVRSAGKLQADDSVDLALQREAAPIVILETPLAAEDYAASPLAARQAGIANRHDQWFEIYAADVQLISDLDGDGHHHALRVVFDADVSTGSATVYAKLYLSREGEHWGHYFTTDLFQIHGDSTDDRYEVETELLDGYYPGYYAVLIELYSLDHAYMVASRVLDYHSIGKDLPVESLDWDEPVYGYQETVVVHGAASIGGLLALLLLVQVVVVARGALAGFPPALRHKPVPIAERESRARNGREQERFP